MDSFLQKFFIFQTKCNNVSFGKKAHQILNMKHYPKVMNKEAQNVNLFEKIFCLQCLWVQKFFDHIFHDWKVIALYVINFETLKTYLKTSNFIPIYTLKSL